MARSPAYPTRSTFCVPRSLRADLKVLITSGARHIIDRGRFVIDQSLIILV